MTNFATPEQLNAIVDFVHTRNNQPRFYSGFMSLEKSRIQKDIKAAIDAKSVLIAEENGLLGVLITHTDHDQKTCDIAGPYVAEDDLGVGKALVERWIQHRAHNLTLQFFFSRQSDYYHALMKQIDATYQGDETILTLSKEDYRSDGERAEVSPMQAHQREAVKRLHNTTFPGVYITGDDIIAAIENTDVYVLTQNDGVIGYGLVKHQGSTTILEVFAIDAAYRGQGRAKPFISRIIDAVFNKEGVNKVQLVVENVNRTALNLYTAIGFIVSRENCAYHRKAK